MLAQQVMTAAAPVPAGRPPTPSACPAGIDRHQRAAGSPDVSTSH